MTAIDETTGVSVREAIFDRITIERARQEVLHPEKNCASIRMFPEWKYLLLGEEVGEVATALQEGDAAALRCELVQVAAVCVGWLESIEFAPENTFG